MGTFCSPSSGVRSHTLALAVGVDTCPPYGAGSQPFSQEPDCRSSGLSRGLPEDEAALSLLSPLYHRLSTYPLIGSPALSGQGTSTTPTLGAPPRPVPSCPLSCSA